MTASARRVLCVVGASRSGSTLLSYLLSQHPCVVAVSQLEWLGQYWSRGQREVCTCGAAVCDCPFWRQVLRRAATKGSVSERELLDRAQIYPRHAPGLLGALRGAFVSSALSLAPAAVLPRLANLSPLIGKGLIGVSHTHAVFDAIRTTTGRPVVVDASKVPQRAHFLYRARPEQVRVVWLVRDGRGVSWSRMRRFKHPMRRAALSWVRANLEVALSVLRIPREHLLILRYEELCTDPNKHLARVFSFLDLEPVTVGLVLDKASVHFVGGNEMRFRPNEVVAMDESWKTNLNERQLRLFGLLGGWLNRRFGYARHG